MMSISSRIQKSWRNMPLLNEGLVLKSLSIKSSIPDAKSVKKIFIEKKEKST